MYLQTPRAGPAPNQMVQQITCSVGNARKTALETWMSNPHANSYLGFATQLTDKLSSYGEGDVLLGLGVADTTGQQPEAYVDVGLTVFPKSQTEAAINYNFFKKVSILGVSLDIVDFKNGRPLLNAPKAAISGLVNVHHTGDMPMAVGRWVMMRLPRTGIGRELQWRPPQLKMPDEKGPNPRNGLELYPLDPLRVKPDDLAAVVQIENILAASQTRKAFEEFLEPLLQAVMHAVVEQVLRQPPVEGEFIQPGEVDGQRGEEGVIPGPSQKTTTYLKRLQDSAEYQRGDHPMNKKVEAYLKELLMLKQEKSTIPRAGGKEEAKASVNAILRLRDTKYGNNNDHTLGCMLAAKLLPVSAGLIHQISAMRLGTVVTPAKPGQRFSCMLSDRASSLYHQLSLS